MLEYKGYSGRAEFDEEAGILHGEVLGLRDVVTFQGRSVEELEEAFRDSVDDYLEFCAERGEEPDRPFSGRLVLRMEPEVHRRAFVRAQREGKSLNRWIVERLEGPEAPTGREEVSVERVPVAEAVAGRVEVGKEEVRIPVTREEVAVEKRPAAREEVREEEARVYDEADAVAVEGDVEREEIYVEGATDDELKPRR